MGYVKYKLPFLKNIYLIRWYPKGISGIHNHSGKNCDVVILNKSLQEYQYTLDKYKFNQTNKQELKASFMYTLPTDMYHDVHNDHNSYVYSLNYYY